jgi:hypothetical protein
MPANPCPPPGRNYQATNGRNQYQIHVQITDSAWLRVPPQEQDLAINVLSATPVNVMPDLKGKGNGIKRESNGWSIHTQSDKSLYDTNIRKGDAGKTNFVFDTYKKRPHS